MANHYSNILKRLETEYKSLERYYGQTVYKLSKDGFVYLRYSSKKIIGEKKKTDKYFFGIETDTIEKLKDFDFTVILICGEENLNFILNKDIFFSIIDGVRISRNQFKINLFCTKEMDELKVTGKPRINISEFKNRFDLILTRIIYREITKQDFYKEEKKTKFIELPKIERIKSKLISNSTKSNKPSLFEEAITTYFKYFGFQCQHIGGAGNTDVLVSNPYRVIIEAKTTTKESIGKIYFTRLKQHKEMNQADFIAVVCNNFEPAVIRDAEIENTLLIQTNLLCKLLDLNDEYPLSPSDLKYIFQLKGLLKEENLRSLRNRLVSLKGKIKNLSTIIQSVDNKKRNLDELFGRYQMKCAELNISSLDRIQFTAFIDFLAMSFIGVITKECDLYYREVSENIALKRLNKVGGCIYETSK